MYAFDPLTRATSSLPIGRDVVALFDTGAGSTVINSKRIDTRGMVPIGSLSGASAGGTAPLYWVQLRFANPALRVNVRTTAIEMTGNIVRSVAVSRPEIAHLAALFSQDVGVASHRPGFKIVALVEGDDLDAQRLRRAA